VTTNFIYIFYCKLYKSIIEFTKNINTDNWYEKIYLFKNNLSDIPICGCDKCKNHTNFSNAGYSYFCTSHKNCFTVSKQENEIKTYIDQLNVDYIKNDRHFGDELDLYFKDINLAIEYNGLYHHSELRKPTYYHYNKWLKCSNENINLIFIWSDMWLNKKEIVKNIIKSYLKIDPIKIYNNFIIKEIDKLTKIKFLNDNHIEENCPSSINLGLFFKNELLSVMTFKYESLNNCFNIRLLRFCNKLNYNIINSHNLMFDYFLNKYKPKKIISYDNLNLYFEIYKNLNFNLVQHNKLDYWWSKGDKRLNKHLFEKRRLVKEGYDVNKSEKEIMLDRKFMRICNAGKFKYELIL
jgi:hypothetical protein